MSKIYSKRHATAPMGLVTFLSYHYVANEIDFLTLEKSKEIEGDSN